MVKVWETSTWKETFMIDKGANDVSNDIAWSPDGNTLVWTDHAGRVSTWERLDGRDRTLLDWQSWGVNAIAWSPKAKRLALCNFRQEITIWDLDNLDHGPDILHGPAASVTAIDWNCENQRLASASHDGIVRIWDTEVGVNILSLRGHEGWINCVRWGPNGRFVASASDDGSVRIWEAKSQEFTVIDAARHRIAWHPDGRRIAIVGGEDGLVKILDIKIWEVLRVFDERIEKFATAMNWDSSGRRLAASGADGTVRIWDADSGKQIVLLRSDREQTRSLGAQMVVYLRLAGTTASSKYGMPRPVKRLLDLHITSTLLDRLYGVTTEDTLHQPVGIK